MLPREYPRPQCHGYYPRFRRDGTRERTHTYLREQVRVMMGREATPIGAILDSYLAPYAEAVRAVAQGKKTPLVGLHARSIAFYEAQGKEKINAISASKEGGKLDGTHLNAAGGAAIAPLVVDELKKAVPTLASQFVR